MSPNLIKMSTRAIQFVYPQSTKTVSLSGGGCALNCSHCNSHYIEQMDTLDSPVPEGTKSFLISGGLKTNGKSFILDKKEKLLKIKAEGKYHFNSHVGFVDPDELDELAKIVDYVSFDFVSDAGVIKRVYKLDRDPQEYVKLYQLLTTKIKTYPHVTIGLDGGKIHWEYEAIDILADLGADRLVLNVLIPTPGTEFADVPPPDLAEVTKVVQYARKAFAGKPLIVGCMRPGGKYRVAFDMMAVEEGVDRIVQPTMGARWLAQKKGYEISYLYECCALDTKSHAERPASKNAKAGACCSGSAPMASVTPVVGKKEGGCCGSHSEERERAGSCCKTKPEGEKALSHLQVLDPTMRVSSGSAAVLGLKEVKTNAKPTTIYLMNSGGCEYSCGFCAQGKHATSKEDKLSRVTWPEYSTDRVLDTLAQKQDDYKRICMQVVNTKEIFKTLPKTVAALRAKAPRAKLAMTIRTYNLADLDAMFDAGVNEVGLSIDAIDPEQFKKIKGGSFEAHKAFVLKAADKYPGKIATHLIVGLGETEKQVVELMEELHQHQVIIALFAFTPVKGSRMEFSAPPDMASYRRIQVTLHLIRNNLPHRVSYDENGCITGYGHTQDGLMAMLKGSNVFETSGCSDCNRPYYNERAGAKELYNHPDKIRDEAIQAKLGAILG